jgi:hypothetical protein
MTASKCNSEACRTGKEYGRKKNEKLIVQKLTAYSK